MASPAPQTRSARPCASSRTAWARTPLHHLPHQRLHRRADEYDILTRLLKVVKEIPFSDGERAAVKCYGANDVSGRRCHHEERDVQCSITGTNPVRFQHLAAGTYKKWAIENGKKYFSVASGGGTGRTLHPDNVAAGPASYGLTDSLGRVHGDAQFAGSSSVPAHVEMMGLIGMGNNLHGRNCCLRAVAAALRQRLIFFS